MSNIGQFVGYKLGHRGCVGIIYTYSATDQIHKNVEEPKLEIAIRLTPTAFANFHLFPANAPK